MLLAISQGASWGWTDGRTLGLFALAVVALLAWGWWEHRTHGDVRDPGPRVEPLVDLRTTVRPQVLLANLASMVFGFAMFAMSLVLPQLLQMPKATGFGLGQRTRGPKVTLMVGALVVAAG